MFTVALRTATVMDVVAGSQAVSPAGARVGPVNRFHVRQVCQAPLSRVLSTLLSSRSETSLSMLTAERWPTRR